MKEVTYTFEGVIVDKKGKPEFVYEYVIKDANTGKLLHTGQRSGGIPPRTVMNNVVREFTKKYGYTTYNVTFSMLDIG